VDGHFVDIYPQSRVALAWEARMELWSRGTGFAILYCEGNAPRTDREKKMTKGKILLAALAVAVTLILMGGGAEASPTPSWSGGAVLIAGNEAEDSAKMGKEEGTHTGPD
jgi:hypothetical protein